MQAQTSNLADIIERLELITKLRWAAWVVLAFSVLIIFFVSRLALHAAILLVIAAVLLYNAVAVAHTKLLRRNIHSIDTGRRALLALIVFGVFDLIALTFGIYYTGGIESPYLLLLLVYMVGVGIVLPRPLGYLVATVVSLLLLGIDLLPDPSLYLAGASSPSEWGLSALLSSRQYGLLTVPELVIWLLFTTAAYFAVFVVDHVTAGLNRRQQEVSNLLCEREKALNRLGALQQIGTEISSLADLNTVLDLIVRKARDLFATNVAFLGLREGDDEHITVTVADGEGSDVLKGITMTSGQGMGGMVMATGKPVTVINYMTDPRLVGRPPEAMKAAQLKSGMAAPLSVGERRIGVLYVFNSVETAFDNSDVHLLSALANQAAIAIQNAHLYTDLRKAALTDSLTGLYNWRYLRERLQNEIARAARYQGKLALIMADCDSLKEVNDRFGHQVGDILLLQTGRVLQDNVRESDVVIRYGGDEFVVLLPETDIAAALEVAERTRAKVEDADLIVDGNRVEITVSFGIAAYPDDAVDAEDMLLKADNALYRAKSLGKNRVCLVDAAR